MSLYSPEQSSLHESEGLLLPSLHLLQPSFLSVTSSFSAILKIQIVSCYFSFDDTDTVSSRTFASIL